MNLSPVTGEEVKIKNDTRCFIQDPDTEKWVEK